MSKRLNDLIQQKRNNSEKLLSIFVTAGFPKKDETVEIILDLADAGVDFIELGIPFSDPVADGPVIQEASETALNNGIKLVDIIQIVKDVRLKSMIPIILMGYINPVYQYGFEKFFQDAAKADVDGFILPDWPIEESIEFIDRLKTLDLDLIYLIAPNTPQKRIAYIDRISTSFIYCVAYTGVTGRSGAIETMGSIDFLKKLNNTLSTPHLIGFGVKNKNDFNYYSQFADGAIVGSAFIKLLKESKISQRSQEIHKFIVALRGNV